MTSSPVTAVPDEAWLCRGRVPVPLSTSYLSSVFAPRVPSRVGDTEVDTALLCPGGVLPEQSGEE